VRQITKKCDLQQNSDSYESLCTFRMILMH
jgi:hypothetical protein